jgi:hypothetical protein
MIDRLSPEYLNSKKSFDQAKEYQRMGENLEKQAKIYALYENSAYTKEFIINYTVPLDGVWSDDWVIFEGIGSHRMMIPRNQIKAFSRFVQQVAAEAAK